MPFRQFDFECQACGENHADLVWVDHGSDPPSQAWLECPHCCKEGEESEHDRLMSAPAKYMYDRPWAPMIKGGKFDTEGNRRLPPLPELPYDKDFDTARDRFHSKFYQDRLKERQIRAQENAAKKERARNINRGEPGNDLRTNPLPGDPPMERVVGKKRKKVDVSKKRVVAG